MNFGQAIEALKDGKKVSRVGWNASNMFVFLVDGSTFEVNRAPLNKIYPEGTIINYRPHIDIKASNGDICTWSPSISDVLEEDWGIVE